MAVPLGWASGRNPALRSRDRFAYQELVHAGEGGRSLRLESVPAIEVEAFSRLRKSRAEAVVGKHVEKKAAELQSICHQE